MKLSLFCLIVLLLVDECKSRRTIKDLLARNRKRRAVPESYVDIRIRSEGCNDPGMTPGTCGIAYIWVNGIDHSPHGRGHNVVIVDATTGVAIGAASFDTHGDGTAGNRLRDYLNGIHGNKIVLVAIQDSGSNHFPEAVDALKRLGATDPILIDFRGSFALAGYAGVNKPSWIAQQQARRFQGPSEISLRVPLTPNCNGPLGMETGAISDGQLAASTEWDAPLNIIQGRLHGPTCWAARINDVNQWYQVDLGSKYTKVTGVATQGRGDHPQWVTRYKLQFGIDGVNFHYYRKQGQDKEFVANADQNTVVYHALIPPVITRYIRFRPRAWHGHISMRLEVYGCSDCNGPLGMETGAISDGQLAASTEWDAPLNTIQGRLHGPTCWAARINDVNQWYQVDLGSLYTKVTDVATQGRGDYPQWVTRYKLQFGNNGVSFQYYRKQGQDKEFIANADQNTVVYHALSPPVITRYIRFRPRAWHGHISMRVEVYGCPDCQEAVGMENYAIPDGQISASSQWDVNHAAIQGRLHFKAGGGKQGAWSARYNDVNQWLQINLNTYTTVTRVASQGRNAAYQWVTKYKLQYSTGGANFRDYKERGQPAAKEFTANSDRDTVVYHDLNPPFDASYVRFRPLTWHNHISMRVELYGCPALDLCSLGHDCKNGATCVNLDGGNYRCDCTSGYSGNYCETDINECTNNPCQNGATCVNLDGSYRCDCTLGYTGNNCETDINECTNNPCLNGATCVNLQGSYSCDCTSGYTGNNCETDINECSPDPCQNGGTCVDLVGSYRCDCISGYSGINCETDINECSPDPCQNGGTCVDLVGSYRCDCTSGYSGTNCETVLVLEYSIPTLELLLEAAAPQEPLHQRPLRYSNAAPAGGDQCSWDPLLHPSLGIPYIHRVTWRQFPHLDATLIMLSLLSVLLVLNVIFHIGR
ncbi:hypothetical protein ACROYT_G022549 [Oculina patagonica]